MTSCWSVADYVLAQVISSATWAAMLGVGGVVVLLVRRRLRKRPRTCACCGCDLEKPPLSVLP